MQPMGSPEHAGGAVHSVPPLAIPSSPHSSPGSHSPFVPQPSSRVQLPGGAVPPPSLSLQPIGFTHVPGGLLPSWHPFGSVHVPGVSSPQPFGSVQPPGAVLGSSPGGQPCGFVHVPGVTGCSPF